MASRNNPKRLTKTVVEGAELPDRSAGAYFIWDSILRGFGVRIFPTGLRTYVVDYRPRDGGSRKRMTLGAHGAVTCEQARDLARAVLGDVVRGEDPALERQTRRKSLTIAELCERYLAAADLVEIAGKGQRPKKASTLVSDRGRIERHIKPLLGRRLVMDITRADCVRFLADVSGGKTAAVVKTGRKRGKAIVEGGAGTGRRTLGLLGALLTYAVDQGVIDSNPARGIKRGPDGVRDRRLTPDEYRALGKALVVAEEAGEPWQAVEGVRLLAFTGCRLSEIQGLTWDELDLPRCTLRLKDSKEGRSIRPLGAAAIAVLRSLPSDEDPPFVLAGVRRRGGFRSLASAVQRITARAGIEGVTAHVLRHSFASVAADLGFSMPTIAALLGHAAGGVTARYIHVLDAVMVQAADKVAGEVRAQMERDAAAVVALDPSRSRA